MKFFNILHAIFKLTSEIGCLAIKCCKKYVCFAHCQTVHKGDCKLSEKIGKTGEKRQRLVFYRKGTKPLLYVVKNNKKIKKYTLGEII